MKSPQAGLTPSLVALMSVATGLSVACNYYVQPLLETVARTFHLSVNQAGFIVTTAQLGYAAGLLLLVPLGDMLERRGLIVIMSLLAAGGMVITALSPTLPLMLLGTVLTGLFSVVAQILVPLAATLAAPEKRGKVVGTVMSGLLLGILLARTVAGGLAQLGGWRTVYWVASVLMVLMALALWRFFTALQAIGSVKLRTVAQLYFQPVRAFPSVKNPRHNRLPRLRQLQRAVDIDGLPAGFSALWLF